MQPTNWWPGLIALGLGVVIGAFVLRFVGKKRAPVVDDLTDEKQLDAKKRALVDQLRELEADKHLYAPEAFAVEKQRLEQEAVLNMKAKDAAKAQRHKKKDAPAPVVRRPGIGDTHPRAYGAFWGASVTAFIAFAYFMVTGAGTPATVMPVSNANDPRYEALLVLSSISISLPDSEQLLQAWELYMRQKPPRRRPPQLQRAIDWLEKVTNGVEVEEK